VITDGGSSWQTQGGMEQVQGDLFDPVSVKNEKGTKKLLSLLLPLINQTKS